MTVEIQVNWNFRKDGDEAHVSYRTGKAEPTHPNGHEHDKRAQSVMRVVPLGSSVLAPGMSMPLPTR
jgi:hypothetical protein